MCHIYISKFQNKCQLEGLFNLYIKCYFSILLHNISIEQCDL